MFIPETVKKAVDTYMSLSHKLLPDYQLELFIHGSIGLNTYESNKSDIDCIIVTNPELTLDQKEILNQLHLQFEQQENIPMDCVYIAKADLSSQSPFLNTYFYYNEGTLSYGDYFNFNPVTWWTLHQNYQDSPFPTTTGSQLRDYVFQNMQQYWKPYIERLKREVQLDLSISDEEIKEEIEWIVLGLLRQFYTLKEVGVTSKYDAGIYGLQHLPKQWHPIIQLAIRIRKNELVVVSVETMNQVIDFAEFLISYCEKLKSTD